MQLFKHFLKSLEATKWKLNRVLRKHLRLHRNVKEGLLCIMAVHPMRKEAVDEFLKKANADWKVIEKVLKENKLIELEYERKKYYM